MSAFKLINITLLIYSVLVTRHVDGMVVADIRTILATVDHQDYSLAREGSNATFSDYLSAENILKKVAIWEKEDQAKNDSAKVDNETMAREPMSEGGTMMIGSMREEEKIADIVGSTEDIEGSVTDVVGSETDILESTTDSLGSTTESDRDNIDIVRSTTELGEIIDIESTTEMERIINILRSTTEVEQITEVGSTTETGSTIEISGSTTNKVGNAIDVEKIDNNSNKQGQQNNETGVGCPEDNIDYFNNGKNDIIKFKHAKRVEGWQACSDLCRTEFTECKFWTWVKSGKCMVKINNEGREKNRNTISGSRECGTNDLRKESGKVNNKNQPDSAECSALQGITKTKNSWNCNQDGSYSCSTTITDCSDCNNIGTITRGEKVVDKDGNVSQEGLGGWDCGDKCRNSSRGAETHNKGKQCEHEHL